MNKKRNSRRQLVRKFANSKVVKVPDHASAAKVAKVAEAIKRGKYSKMNEEDLRELVQQLRSEVHELREIVNMLLQLIMEEEEDEGGFDNSFEPDGQYPSLKNFTM